MELSRCPSPETIASHLTNTIHSNLVKDHVCHFNRCTIINIKVEIHKHPKNNRYGIRSRYMTTPDWITNNTLVERIYSLYLCKNTGKIHNCHQNCDGDRTNNEDNCKVCCISGIQYAAESVRSWKISSRCVPTITANKQDPYMYSRDTEGRVKLSGVHNLKMTQCIMMAKEFIERLLFSNERMRSERYKTLENKKDAEKIVNKYKRYCDRNNQPKVYVNMVMLYITRINRKPMYTKLLLKNQEEKEEIIKTYTIQMIGYWKMILYRTNLGREMSSLFSFKSFIPACLYIMKAGIIMHGVPIIEKSRYLESALPEANTLDSYNVSKPSFTQTKNNILKAIRETIEARNTTPDQLKQFRIAESKKVSY